MKRIQSACICQTLHFMLKDEVEREEARRLLRLEADHYRHTLERNGTKFRILEEQEQEDGSIVLKIIKQYNSSPVGDYLK